MAKTGMQMVLEAMGLNTTEIQGMIDKAKVEIPEFVKSLETTVNNINEKFVAIESRLIFLEDRARYTEDYLQKLYEFAVRVEARDLAREQILNPGQQEDFPLLDSEQPISEAAMELWLEKIGAENGGNPDDGRNKRE